MDSRIILRIPDQDALYLRYIAEELGLNLSEFVRLKVMGKSFDELYLKLIKRNIQTLEIGKVFTLRKLLIINDKGEDFKNELHVSHFDYLSRNEKNALVQLVIEEIDNEEINASYYDRKNGKYGFKKTNIPYSWDD